MTLVIVLTAWLALLSLFTGLCMVARRGDVDQGALIRDTARAAAATEARRGTARELARPAAPQTVAAAHRGARHVSVASSGSALAQRGRVAA